MSIYQKKIVPMLYFMDFDAVKSVIIGIKSQGNFVKSQGKVRELYFLMLVATLTVVPNPHYAVIIEKNYFISCVSRKYWSNQFCYIIVIMFKVMVPYLTLFVIYKVGYPILNTVEFHPLT